VQKQLYISPDQGCSALSLADLASLAREWVEDGKARQLARGTLANRRLVTDKLLWFLRQHELPQCGRREIRQFLAYISNGHETEEGRWGNDHNRRPMRPVSARFYFAYLSSFFNFAVTEEQSLTSSPMVGLAAPSAKADQIKPFTDEQTYALLAAACRSHHPKRDEAIVLFLLDTGARASELCQLRVGDVDMDGRRCTVLGKGNKRRTLHFGRRTRKALWAYQKAEPRDDDAALFLSDRGAGDGTAFTRSGLLQLIRRLGKAANIEACRCSPHTFRHTFSVSFLRNGGNVFTLKELLGHTTLTMVQRYVALAQAD
jgi:integrase/recombinase XerD